MRSLKACSFLLMDTQTTLTAGDSMGWLFPQPCFFHMGVSSYASVLTAAGQGDEIPTLVGPSF